MDASAWNRRYRSTSLSCAEAPNELLTDVTRGLRPGRALDLGAGEGVNACWLASRGWDVTAVDFSDEGLRRARSRAQARRLAVEWSLADIRNWPVPTSAFDLITAVYLQLPPVALLQVLRRAIDGLRPGGTLVVLGLDRENTRLGLAGPHNPDLLYTTRKLRADVGALAIDRCETVTRHTDQGPELDTVLICHATAA